MTTVRSPQLDICHGPGISALVNSTDGSLYSEGRAIQRDGHAYFRTMLWLREVLSRGFLVENLSFFLPSVVYDHQVK